MANRKKESAIVREVLKYLNALPCCKALKYHGSIYTVAGTPDILACIARQMNDDSLVGQMLCFEVKTWGGTVTALQEHELKQWWNASAITAVVHSVDEVQQILEANGLL